MELLYFQQFSSIFSFLFKVFIFAVLWVLLTHLLPMHPFTRPRKQKTIRFSDVFRGKRKDALGINGSKFPATLTGGKNISRSFLGLNFPNFC